MAGAIIEAESDAHLIAAFDKGRAKGRHRAKHYRDQCPIPQRRPLAREAWLVGYDFGYEEGQD